MNILAEEFIFCLVCLLVFYNKSLIWIIDGKVLTAVHMIINIYRAIVYGVIFMFWFVFIHSFGLSDIFLGLFGFSNKLNKKLGLY